MSKLSKLEILDLIVTRFRSKQSNPCLLIKWQNRLKVIRFPNVYFDYLSYSEMGQNVSVISETGHKPVRDVRADAILRSIPQNLKISWKTRKFMKFIGKVVKSRIRSRFWSVLSPFYDPFMTVYDQLGQWPVVPMKRPLTRLTLILRKVTKKWPFSSNFMKSEKTPIFGDTGYPEGVHGWVHWSGPSPRTHYPGTHHPRTAGPSSLSGATTRVSVASHSSPGSFWLQHVSQVTRSFSFLND